MLSNRELAKRYRKKQELLGVNLLDFVILDNNRVELIDVKDKYNDGKLEIPKFITEIRGGSLDGCRYSEVYIDNIGGQLTSLCGLCCGMESNKIKVWCRNPEYISNISFMFDKCYNVEYIDIGNIREAKIRSMVGVFRDCSNLKGIDISMLDTSGVIDMNSVFYGCNSLSDIVIKGIDTSNVRCMDRMFGGCEKLKTIDLNELDLSAIESVDDLFCGCTSIEYIDISKLGLTNLKKASSVFDGCSSLKWVTFSNKLDMVKLRVAARLFSGCNELKGIHINELNIRGDIDITGICYKCSSLTEIKIGKINVVGDIDMYYTNSEFTGCKEASKVVIGGSEYSIGDIKRLLRSDMYSASSIRELLGCM